MVCEEECRYCKISGWTGDHCKRNLKFYAVRKRIATSAVLFYNSNGKTNAAYKKLNKRVAKGSTFTLPEIPKVTGYQGVEWINDPGGSYSIIQSG